LTVGARIGGLALVGVAVLLLLKPYKPEWAVFIRLAVTVLAVGLILVPAGTVIAYVRELSQGAGAPDGETWSILLKALGIAFLTETAASVCRDSGEGGMAGWVELAGKLEILLLSFPLIRTVMETVTALLAGR
jgi:stage III sporulation protein AD